MLRAASVCLLAALPAVRADTCPSIGEEGICKFDEAEARRAIAKDQLLIQRMRRDHGAAGRMEKSVNDQTAAPQCCTDCAGKLGYFSPATGNCYKSQTKHHYLRCPEVDEAARQGTCKTGGDHWCAAMVPDVNFTLMNCPSMGMRVKALTYNLYWWNLFGKRRGNGRSAGRLIKKAAGAEPFDVAGFQECEDPERIMRDAGMNHALYDYVRLDSSALAFKRTRFEVLDRGAGDYVAEDFGRFTYLRGALWARLHEKATGKKLFVVNHQGPLPVNTGGVCGGEATAYNLLNIIRTHSQTGDALLLLGDFNADKGSTTVGTLEEYMQHPMDNWVDHFFSNCGGSAVKEALKLGKGGSDHDALSIVIEF
eukprot:TRINITY_DN50847_c0_g1_i1.p1 TRINITY_DN50847_c0_g1~~TRINITY_DN50847_c0_g1_i1.p1  ORF type:complete len:366 (+),score=62.93 TRINITY_DN50847_c0_g1_i1:117-1214(+)